MSDEAPSEGPLAGFGVLVTRAAQQAGELIGAIEQAGGTAVRFPAIDIEGRGEEAIEQELATLPPADIVLFTSPNAVTYGMVAAARDGVQIAAIGPATRAAIEATGREVDLYPSSGFDSEHLLAEAGLRSVAGKTIRIVRGNGGRELLARTLRERGATVHYLPVYRRLPSRPSAEALAEIERAWRAAQIECVTVMSVESLDNLLAILPQYCRNALHFTPLVTPSKRVIQTVAKKIPSTRTILAPGPLAADMLHALVECRREVGEPNAREGDMNQTNDQTNGQQSNEAVPETTDATVAESGTQAERARLADKTPDARRAHRAPRFSSGVAWLALLLALISLAGVAYFAWIDHLGDTEAAGAQASLDAVSRRMDDASGSLEALQSRVDELAAGDSKRSDEITALDKRLEKLASEQESVPPRLAGVERSLASLQGISSGSRDTWLMAEAEHYMEIANSELKLAGNPESARLALGFADQRIRELADPALIDVRRALSSELQALDAIVQPDIEGMSVTLASLAENVASLPLRQHIVKRDEEPRAVDAEQSGLDRALASVKAAFSNVVSVRRTDEAVTPLIAPEAAYFLRTNLALQLQTARLALLRGEQTIFDETLKDASDWLTKYYATDSRAVQSALDTLSRLRQGDFSVSTPDISESLRLLRQFRTRTGTEQPAPAAEEPAQ